MKLNNGLLRIDLKVLFEMTIVFSIVSSNSRRKNLAKRNKIRWAGIGRYFFESEAVIS